MHYLVGDGIHDSVKLSEHGSQFGTIVLLDDRVIDRIATKSELAAGRIWQLPDGNVLAVRKPKRFPVPEFDVYWNGEPLRGTPAHSDNRSQRAAQAMRFALIFPIASAACAWYRWPELMDWPVAMITVVVTDLVFLYLAKQILRGSILATRTAIGTVCVSFVLQLVLFFDFAMLFTMALTCFPELLKALTSFREREKRSAEEFKDRYPHWIGAKIVPIDDRWRTCARCSHKFAVATDRLDLPCPFCGYDIQQASPVVMPQAGQFGV